MRPRTSEERHTYTMILDEDQADKIKRLQKSLGVSTQAAVFRYALSLLDRAIEARENGDKLLVANDERERELILPGV